MTENPDLYERFFICLGFEPDGSDWLEPIDKRIRDVEAETKAMRALNQLYQNNEKAMRKLAKTDWDFSDEAETQFVEWFHSDHDLHLLRSDYFYEDCKTRDLSTLESLMAKWLHIAFVSGFERGRACN